MKIQVISDIHIDLLDKRTADLMINRISLYAKDIDVLVIAGDLAEVRKPIFKETVQKFCDKYKHVVFVPGNHEFWGAAFIEAFHELMEIASKINNFHGFYDDSIEIDNQRFIGGTMWFGDTPATRIAQKTWSDFHEIKASKEVFWKLIHDASKYLDDNVKSTDIVVTHHAPLYKSLNPHYFGINGLLGVNAFYLNDKSKLISSAKPKLWIHGHTHYAVDYMAGETRVVSNPLGYFETQPFFEYSSKVIDI